MLNGIRRALGKYRFYQWACFRLMMLRYGTSWRPGHFYSPIPDIADLKIRESTVFETVRQIPGIDLNEKEQLDLLDEFERYQAEYPFEEHKKDNMRYHFGNVMYGYADGIVLYCMIRHAKPRRIIEVGGGYSSALIMDINELFFSNSISHTIIEPYPATLLSLIRETDKLRTEIIRKKVQDVELSRFAELGAGDILFVDSSHVAKAGSDVNYIFFKVLPHIGSGTLIHFHDIFANFEYPKEWLYRGWAWNENYLLRAFLQYNNSFKIVFFTAFLATFHEKALFRAMPLCRGNTGGSIWIRKE